MSFLKSCNLSRVASLEIGPACPSKFIHPFNYHWTSVFRNKDVSIGPGLHLVHSPFHLPSAGASAFKLGGQSFLLILVLEKHAVNNAVISI